MKPHEAQDFAPSLGLVTSGRGLVETTHCAKGKCRTLSGTVTIRPGSSTAVTGLHHTAEVRNLPGGGKKPSAFLQAGV